VKLCPSFDWNTSSKLVQCFCISSAAVAPSFTAAAFCNSCSSTANCISACCSFNLVRYSASFSASYMEQDQKHDIQIIGQAAYGCCFVTIYLLKVHQPAELSSYSTAVSQSKAVKGLKPKPQYTSNVQD